MQGLRTQESKKFEKFIELVQEEAAKKNSVFFLDCGQGKTFENESIECENLCGWLIPKEKVKEFTPIFLKNTDKLFQFDDFYVFIDFTVNENDISIEIDDSPNDLIVEFTLSDEVKIAE
jgi:hypothetical protein